MDTAQAEDCSDSTSGTQFKAQKPRFDSVIVFGEGPVKPVLLDKEITLLQKEQWESYRRDPYTTKEPDFWLLQQPKLLAQIERIYQEEKITINEKQDLIE